MVYPDLSQERDRLDSLFDRESPKNRTHHYERLDKNTGRFKKFETSFSSEDNESVLNSSKDSESESRNQDDPSRLGSIFWILISTCVVIFAILLIYWIYWITPSAEPINKAPCQFHGLTREDLRSHFLNQPKDLSYIVDAILEKERYSVDTLVLLHSSESYSTARCLANRLTETYAYKKRQECSITTIKPTDVNPHDDDFGKVLEKYINNGTAAVVQNLLGITPNSAQIFHTMCDDTIPKNIPSLFVFTLLSSSDPSNVPRREARNILSSAWKDLPDNVLDPLLARILGHVIKVNPEKALPC